ncbi:phosphoribosylformylglycinamidine synthase subunit PurL [Patescibacteria group bacterium]|nr:phosphoribosylformylglycinamidine synthase subunit PurL [Patescibacteria group bacterium]MBU1683304.1 phosphoribosylformylglycinamidine synthase subunit PurL [Patescibacteria group bacterium]MBU1935537.1 phosphoribosylformylglycinamidine synthase subunit PurL [Patescibacteria group bacterium]
MPEYLEFSKMTDEEVKKVLKDNKIGLTVPEARKIETDILGRPPTLTEAVIWGIQGSEHSSYRSSKPFLKQLPTKAPNVILGPVEDAGVVEIARDGDDRWGLVMSHESHNHPSQIVPYEGAATGIGGNVRDVCCMGARVVGTMDPLRMGNLEVNECRVITNEVVRGIAGYGNPIGVPNLGGDIIFSDAFNDNCLVNVLTFGIVKESEIIHSYVPEEAADVGYDIIIVGKPTDNSGMGGAAFASLELDEKDKEANKGAVQEPNPFLKRHLLASTYDLYDRLKKMGKLDKVGFKDHGAGGNVCSTVEQVVDRGFGAEIDVEKIHVDMENLHPSIIAASETQERFAWTCHPELTQMILDHYNVKWELGKVAKNAKASLVGKVKPGGQYVLWYKGEKVVDAQAKDICEGLQYKREIKPKDYSHLKEPEINESDLDYNQLALDILSARNVCSKHSVYNKYDKNVQGNSIIEAGEADAGVIAPLLEKEGVSPKVQKTGVAVAADGITRYSKISPYWQGANAVVESMRNVACVGATPQALTDCLNYNNPEVPELMWEFTEGVRGIAEACRAIPLKEYPDSPTPIISGNVSLYNQIDATAVVGCAGVIKDFNKAITPQLKGEGNQIFLLGDRKDELGGSEFYHLLGHLGANVPQADFEQAKNEIYTVIDAIDSGLLESCHDISEGGLLVTLAEMTMPHPRFGGGELGLDIDLSETGKDLKTYQKAFAETGGFAVEVKPENVDKFKEICENYNLTPINLGTVIADSTFTVKDGDQVISQPLSKLQDTWLNSLAKELK